MAVHQLLSLDYTDLWSTLTYLMTNYRELEIELGDFRDAPLFITYEIRKEFKIIKIVV